ncbi:MAG: hypothetical protein J5I81_03435 [Nitrococcus mobilis]|nr:hypothetical protein [Nitrococcus mobilis]
MSIKIASMVAGLVLFGFVSAANAGEAIALNKAQMDGVTAGFGDPSFSFTKFILIDEYVNKYINKNVYSDTYVDGKLAEGEAFATCFGYDCLSETLTVTDVNPYGTTAYSGSTSASN